MKSSHSAVAASAILVAGCSIIIHPDPLEDVPADGGAASQVGGEGGATGRADDGPTSGGAGGGSGVSGSSGTTNSGCEVGTRNPCFGPDDCVGVQTCGSDKKWSDCVCDDGGAGAPGTGGGGGDAGSSGSADAGTGGTSVSRIIPTLSKLSNGSVV